MNLTYRSHTRIEDLRPNECTIHPAADGSGKRWWLLWASVYRDDRAGELIDIAVPVNPGHGYVENGAGGRTWGLANVGGGTWRASPSINVIDESGARWLHPGVHEAAPSIWHHTPDIIGVPDDDPWCKP